VKADRGAYVQNTTFPGGRTRTSGVYQMSTRTSRNSMSLESPDGQHFDVRFVGFRDVNYMNMPGWSGGLGRCWLRFTTESLARETGMDTVAGSGGLPANVKALSHARGTRTSRADDELVLGTVDLVGAASMFGSGVLKFFDDTTLAAPIGAEFTIVDGELVGWRTTGQSLVAAMDREGLLAGSSDGIRDSLLEFEVEVEYDQVGSANIAVRPPGQALVMSPEQFESGEGCAAVH
jgi:hypothetical protein